MFKDLPIGIRLQGRNDPPSITVEIGAKKPFSLIRALIPLMRFHKSILRESAIMSRLSPWWARRIWHLFLVYAEHLVRMDIRT